MTTFNPVFTSQSIGDGYHTRMDLASNNKLFIGAIRCTNDSSTNTGCLTIYDTGANSAVIDTGKGAVTGIAPLPTATWCT